MNQHSDAAVSGSKRVMNNVTSFKNYLRQRKFAMCVCIRLHSLFNKPDDVAKKKLMKYQENGIFETIVLFNFINGFCTFRE